MIGQPLLQVVNQACTSSSALIGALVRLGAEPYASPLIGQHKDYYTLMLDGRLVGWVLDRDIEQFVCALRHLKVNGEKTVSMRGMETKGSMGLFGSSLLVLFRSTL